MRWRMAANSCLRGGGAPAATPLSQIDGTTTFVTVNQRCTRKAGQLGSRKGELVVLACDVPMTGRYVAIQLD